MREEEKKKLLRNTKTETTKIQKKPFFIFQIRYQNDIVDAGSEKGTMVPVITIFMQPYLRVINLTKNF